MHLFFRLTVFKDMESEDTTVWVQILRDSLKGLEESLKTPPPAIVEQPEPPFTSSIQDQSKILSPSEAELLFQTVDEEELAVILWRIEQGEKRNASELSECTKESQWQPTTSQSTAASHCAPQAFATCNALSRNRTLNDAEDKHYIRKPPNAFMLFRAAQRERVVQELNITDSAKVNVEIGQRWRMLSEEDKAPYFDQAHRERRAHEAKYPGWSPKDNINKKPKRRKADNITDAPSHFPVAPGNLQPATGLHAPALVPIQASIIHEAWAPDNQSEYYRAWSPNNQDLY